MSMVVQTEKVDIFLLEILGLKGVDIMGEELAIKV